LARGGSPNASKKDDRVNVIFIIIGMVLGLVIVGLLIYIASTIKK
jgi:flagellar basal body-associated protein FliL